MKTHAKFSLILIVILALVAVGTVAAQSETLADSPGPCAEGTVSGTVVAVEPGDAEGTWVVTVEQESQELCTVTIEGDEDGHPVATLLGKFFSDVSAEALVETLDKLDVCVEEDEDANWEIIECAEGQEPNATVIEIGEPNGDGLIPVTLEVPSGTLVIYLDPSDEGDEQTPGDKAILDALSEVFEALMVNWDVEDDGTLESATEEIEALHESGMGFGVIVKLYAMAQESQEDCDTEEPVDGETEALEEDPAEAAACGVTVEELVEEFRSGTGIGLLFKEHGKPDYLGVGHVRQEFKNDDNGDDDDEDPAAATTILRNGPGNGQEQGNKPEVPPGQAKKQDSGPDTDIQGQNSGPANNNGNGNANGKANGKGKGKP